MSTVNVTPDMQLPNPVPGVDPGPDYASNIQSCFNIIDQHNHTAGQGVQIVPAAININTDLPFNGNNAISLRSVRFLSQSLPIPNSSPDNGILYVSGNELWYNDYNGGNQIQITLNGLINATSSGISNGTATASFSAGTLVVKSSSTSYANIDVQSVVLANAGNLVNQLTLLAPTLSSSYDLTLPIVPAQTSFLTIDSSGNISSGTPTNASLDGSNIVSDVNLSGSAVQENGKNVVVSNTNATTNSLAIVRGAINGSGATISGEGFSAVHAGTGIYSITFTTPFLDTPVITTAVENNAVAFAMIGPGTLTSSGFDLQTFNFVGSFTNIGARACFVAIGQRA